MSELDESIISESTQSSLSPLTESGEKKEIMHLIVRKAKPMPFPDDFFDVIEDIEYVPPPPKIVGTVYVKIASVVKGKPLPYPLDD